MTAVTIPTCIYCGFYMMVERRHDGTEHHRWCPNDKCNGNVGVFGDGAQVVSSAAEKEPPDLEITMLPCGKRCGASYTVLGLCEPAEVQRAALDSGWGVDTVDGQQVVVCNRCRARAERGRT